MTKKSNHQLEFAASDNADQAPEKQAVDTADGEDTKPPTPTEFRQMLVRGTEDFLTKFPPATAEEIVDDALAKGFVKPPSSVVADGPRSEPSDLDDSDEFSWARDNAVIVREQRATAIYFNPEGELVIRQQATWDREEDAFIFISKPFQEAFLDRLCDVLGVPSVGA
jgi:hypothetical protein